MEKYTFNQLPAITLKVYVPLLFVSTFLSTGLIAADFLFDLWHPLVKSLIVGLQLLIWAPYITGFLVINRKNRFGLFGLFVLLTYPEWSHWLGWQSPSLLFLSIIVLVPFFWIKGNADIERMVKEFSVQLPFLAK